jgi:hypothetical protein
METINFGFTLMQLQNNKTLPVFKMLAGLKALTVVTFS